MRNAHFTAAHISDDASSILRGLKDGHRGRLSKVSSKYREQKNYINKPATTAGLQLAHGWRKYRSNCICCKKCGTP